MKVLKRVGLVSALGVAGLLVSSLPAFAAGDAVTAAAASAAASFSSDGNAAMASIGGAIIGLAGVAVLYKWVKGMFFS